MTQSPTTALFFAALLVLIGLNCPLLAAEQEQMVSFSTTAGESELFINELAPDRDFTSGKAGSGNPAGNPGLVIYVQEREDIRPGLAALFTNLQQAGFTVWHANPLEARFLERSASNVRSLDGAAIEALLEAAEKWAAEHSQSGNQVHYLLFTAERMSVPLLRGVRKAFAHGAVSDHFGGVALAYPNLYSHNPMAGTDPVLLPIATQVGFPVTILLPERDPLRSRLMDLYTSLRSQDAPVFLRLVPNVRHLYFLHAPGENPHEDRIRREMPGHFAQSMRLMNGVLDIPLAEAVSKNTLVSADHKPAVHRSVRGLVPFAGRPQAPDFRLLASRGGAVSPSDSRGKVVLVNFWATWCAPCLHEIPSMNRLMDHYQGQGFELVSVNFKEEPFHIRQFLHSVDVDFPVLLDPQGNAAQDWNVFAFPSSFLLDRQGRIRYSVNSAIEWDSDQAEHIIDALLAEPAEEQ